MYYSAVFKADSFECLYLSKFNSNNWAWFFCCCFRTSTLQKSSSLSSLRKEASEVVGLVSYLLAHRCDTSVVALWVLCCLLRNSESKQGSLWHVMAVLTCMWHLPRSVKEEICSWKHWWVFFPLCMRLLPEALLLCFCSDNEVGLFYLICFSDLRQEKSNSHHHFLPVFKVNNFERPCN